MQTPTSRTGWGVRVVRFLTQSLGLRFLVALALSALVWAGLTLELNPNAQELFSDNIPVEDVNLGPNLLVAAPIQPVRVSISGPKVNLTRLTVRDFVARVDLADVGAGQHQLPVIVQISDPAVEVVRMTPETVSVQLDPLETQAVPIVVRVASAPAAGFRAEIADITAEPSKVTVSGAASAVERVVAVQADMSLEGATRVVTAQSVLTPVDRQGDEVENVRVDPQTAQISVPVTRITSRKRVPVVAQVEGTAAPGFFVSQISVVPTTVELEGQPEHLERVDAVQTLPVDITDARGDVERELGFVQPPGVTVVSDQPFARVTVVVEPLEDSTTVQAAVVLRNLSTGLQAVADPQSVQIVIAGAAEVLREVRGGDIVAEVDLRNRAPGLHQIRPVINVTAGIGVVEVTPPFVQVRVTVTSAEAGATPTAIIGPGGAVPTPTPTPTPTATPTPTPTPSPTPRVSPQG